MLPHFIFLGKIFLGFYCVCVCVLVCIGLHMQLCVVCVRLLGVAWFTAESEDAHQSWPETEPSKGLAWLRMPSEVQ